jgi:Uma2 family endonuclease
MGRSAIAHVIDPRDPRAPTQSVWDQLDEAERRRVLEMLPSEIERAEPPEGDAHSRPKHRARETLDEHFRRIGRRIYLASELPVYYPDEPMFAPDLLAVRDVEPHERDHWTVSHEGRGLDLVVEIHVRGSASKDFEGNVERYARLGIPEYFAYAPRRGRLAGWSLPEAGARSYQPLVPQAGRWHSRILDLDLALDEGQLRFYYGSAALLDARELIARLSTMVDRATERAEQEAQRAERYAARLREAGIDPDEPVDRGGSTSG